jgi:hypothetical protein
MFTYKSNDWELIGGARVEHTNQGYNMLFAQGESRPSGNQIYTDILPSLTAKYHLTIRNSYMPHIIRPLTALVFMN